MSQRYINLHNVMMYLMLMSINISMPYMAAAAPVAAAPPSPDVCITFESMDTASKWGFSDPGPVWVSNHDKNNDDNWQSTHVQVI